MCLLDCFRCVVVAYPCVSNLSSLLRRGPLTVSQLSEIIDEKPVAVIKYLMTDLGVMASMTQSLDPATSVAVAEGFGKIVGGDEDFDEE